jgi:hypothetical protein
VTCVSEARYCDVFRHRVSGRAQKRLLNRAVSCRLCGGRLGTDRALFRAYTGFMACELIPAHPACAGAEAREIRERRANALGTCCPSCGAGILDLPPGHGLAIHGSGTGPWSAECRNGIPVCLTASPGSGYVIEAWETVAAIAFHDDFRRHEAQALKAIAGDGAADFTGLLSAMLGPGQSPSPGPPYTHVLKHPETEEEMAAAFDQPMLTISRESE